MFEFILLHVICISIHLLSLLNGVVPKSPPDAAEDVPETVAVVLVGAPKTDFCAPNEDCPITLAVVAGVVKTLEPVDTAPKTDVDEPKPKALPVAPNKPLLPPEVVVVTEPNTLVPVDMTDPNRLPPETEVESEDPNTPELDCVVFGDVTTSSDGSAG